MRILLPTIVATALFASQLAGASAAPAPAAPQGLTASSAVLLAKAKPRKTKAHKPAKAKKVSLKGQQKQ